MDAIIEATTQILASEGITRLSTNRIAKRAGVSIGTLYQYFENKEEVVRTVILRFEEETSAVIREHIAAAAVGNSLYDNVPVVIDALLEITRGDAASHGALLNQLLEAGFAAEFEVADERMEVFLAGMLMNEIRDTALESPLVSAKMIVRSVLGILRISLRRDPELVQTPEFREELIRLIRRYAWERAD